ncbi:DUF6198 family protein [Mycoplasmatota bacterium WC44]
MIIRRVAVYVLGLFVLSLGVAFSIISMLGVSPVSSVAYVLNNVTGLTIGTVTIIEFSIYVLIQLLLLKRDFKIKSFLQVLFGTVFGIFVDLSLFITNTLEANSMGAQVIYLILSIVLIALGLVLILTADIVPNAPEGLMLAIQKVTKFKFSNIKTVFDSSCVLFSSIVALLLLNSFTDSGIWVGTFVTALLVGKVLGIFMTKLKKPVLAFINVT